MYIPGLMHTVAISSCCSFTPYFIHFRDRIFSFTLSLFFSVALFSHCFFPSFFFVGFSFSLFGCVFIHVAHRTIGIWCEKFVFVLQSLMAKSRVICMLWWSLHLNNGLLSLFPPPFLLQLFYVLWCTQHPNRLINMIENI